MSLIKTYLHELQSQTQMQTTVATYSIQVTEEGGFTSFLKTMPTRPTTHRGIKSQNNKLSKWVEKCYPDFTSYEVILLDS
jgi:hypothetical protein